MKKLVIALFVFSGIQIGIAQTTWNLDKGHSGLRFTVTHMVIAEVEGTFNDFEAKIVSQNEDFNGASVEFSAKIGSVDTGNERRDGHLKSDDFFSAETHPEMSFKGKIMKSGEKYKVVGDLTLKGVTKSEEFDLKYNGQIPGRSGKKAGFKLTGSIDRFAYGLTWDRALETGSLVVGKQVEITANVEMNEEVTEGDN